MKMVKSKEDKSPRITVACNACRSRKQKCSGKKPVCQQCLEYHRPCNWPEQLRRGPPKGHIEALEHRLQVTENALLRLLSQVSETQLSAAFPNNCSIAREDTTYMPMARIGKRGIEEWAQFSLDTADNIQKWQRACTGQDTTGPSQEARRDEQHSSIRSDCSSDRKRKHTALELFENQSLEEQAQSANALDSRREREGWSSTPNTFCPSPERSFLRAETHQSPSIERIEADVVGTFTTRSRLQIPDDQPTAAQMSDFWDGAPSLSFQQRFLW